MYCIGSKLRYLSSIFVRSCTVNVSNVTEKYQNYHRKKAWSLGVKLYHKHRLFTNFCNCFSSLQFTDVILVKQINAFIKINKNPLAIENFIRKGVVVVLAASFQVSVMLYFVFEFT